MLNQGRLSLGKVPFGVVVLISFAVLFSPESGVPTTPPGTGEVVHLLLFAALGGTGLPAGFRAWPLLAGLVCYAVASEIAQGVLPLGRDGDPVDAVTDVAGAVIGMAAWMLLVRWRKR